MEDQPLPLFACILNTLDCDLQGRKINFTNSKPLVSRPTVLSITFDLPECKEPFEKNEKKRKPTKNWEQEDEKKLDVFNAFRISEQQCCMEIDSVLSRFLLRSKG